jgi:hypothetical protein
MSIPGSVFVSAEKLRTTSPAKITTTRLSATSPVTSKRRSDVLRRPPTARLAEDASVALTRRPVRYAGAMPKMSAVTAVTPE